jgi:phage terminase small subunit
MIGHGEKLSRKQEQVITALVTCPSITEAAAQCGLAEVTLRRWLKQGPFQAAYREARRAVVQQAITQVQQATGEAVETLRSVMQDSEAPASARVSAAKAVLETAIKGRCFRGVGLLFSRGV